MRFQSNTSKGGKDEWSVTLKQARRAREGVEFFKQWNYRYKSYKEQNQIEDYAGYFDEKTGMNYLHERVLHTASHLDASGSCKYFLPVCSIRPDLLYQLDYKAQTPLSFLLSTPFVISKEVKIGRWGNEVEKQLKENHKDKSIFLLELLKCGASLTQAVTARSAYKTLWSNSLTASSSTSFAVACGAQTVGCLRANISTEFFASYILSMYSRVVAISRNTKEVEHALQIADTFFEKEMKTFYGFGVHFSQTVEEWTLDLLSRVNGGDGVWSGKRVKHPMPSVKFIRFNNNLPSLEFSIAGFLYIAHYLSRYGEEKNELIKELLKDLHSKFIVERAQQYKNIMHAQKEGIKCDIEFTKDGYDLIRQTIINKDIFLKSLIELGYDVKESHYNMKLKKGLVALAQEHEISTPIISLIRNKLYPRGLLEELEECTVNQTKRMDIIQSLERLQSEKTLALIKDILTKKAKAAGDLRSFANLKLPVLIANLKRAMNSTGELADKIKDSIEYGQEERKHIANRALMIVYALKILKGEDPKNLKLLEESGYANRMDHYAAQSLKDVGNAIQDFCEKAPIYAELLEKFCDIRSAPKGEKDEIKLSALDQVVNTVANLAAEAECAIFTEHSKILYYSNHLNCDKTKELAEIREKFGDDKERLEHATKFLNEAELLHGQASALEKSSKYSLTLAENKTPELEALKLDICIVKLPNVVVKIQKLAKIMIDLVERMEVKAKNHYREYDRVNKEVNNTADNAFAKVVDSELQFASEVKAIINKYGKEREQLGEELLKEINNPAKKPGHEIIESIILILRRVRLSRATIKHVTKHVREVIANEVRIIKYLTTITKQSIEFLKEEVAKARAESNNTKASALNEKLGKAMHALSTVLGIEAFNKSLLQEAKRLVAEAKSLEFEVKALTEKPDKPSEGVEEAETLVIKPYQEKETDKQLRAEIRYTGEIRDTAKAISAIDALEEAMGRIKEMRQSLDNFRGIKEDVKNAVQANSKQMEKASESLENVTEKLQHLETNFTTLVRMKGVNKDTRQIMVSIEKLKELTSKIRIADEKIKVACKSSNEKIEHIHKNIKTTEILIKQLQEISLMDVKFTAEAETKSSQIQNISVLIKQLDKSIRKVVHRNVKGIKNEHRHITKALNAINKLEKTMRLLGAFDIPEEKQPLPTKQSAGDSPPTKTVPIKKLESEISRIMDCRNTATQFLGSHKGKIVETLSALNKQMRCLEALENEVKAKSENTSNTQRTIDSLRERATILIKGFQDTLAYINSRQKEREKLNEDVREAAAKFEKIKSAGEDDENFHYKSKALSLEIKRIWFLESPIAKDINNKLLNNNKSIENALNYINRASYYIKDSKASDLLAQKIRHKKPYEERSVDKNLLAEVRYVVKNRDLNQIIYAVDIIEELQTIKKEISRLEFSIIEEKVLNLLQAKAAQANKISRSFANFRERLVEVENAFKQWILMQSISKSANQIMNRVIALKELVDKIGKLKYQINHNLRICRESIEKLVNRTKPYLLDRMVTLENKIMQNMNNMDSEFRDEVYEQVDSIFVEIIQYDENLKSIEHTMKKNQDRVMMATDMLTEASNAINNLEEKLEELGVFDTLEEIEEPQPPIVQQIDDYRTSASTTQNLPIEQSEHTLSHIITLRGAAIKSLEIDKKKTVEIINILSAQVECLNRLERKIEVRGKDEGIKKMRNTIDDLREGLIALIEEFQAHIVNYIEDKQEEILLLNNGITKVAGELEETKFSDKTDKTLLYRVQSLLRETNKILSIATQLANGVQNETEYNDRRVADAYNYLSQASSAIKSFEASARLPKYVGKPKKENKLQNSEEMFSGLLETIKDVDESLDVDKKLHLSKISHDTNFNFGNINQEQVGADLKDENKVKFDFKSIISKQAHASIISTAHQTLAIKESALLPPSDQAPSEGMEDVERKRLISFTSKFKPSKSQRGSKLYFKENLLGISDQPAANEVSDGALGLISKSKAPQEKIGSFTEKKQDQDAQKEEFLAL